MLINKVTCNSIGNIRNGMWTCTRERGRANLSSITRNPRGWLNFKKKRLTWWHHTLPAGPKPHQAQDHSSQGGQSRPPLGCVLREILPPVGTACHAPPGAGERVSLVSRGAPGALQVTLWELMAEWCCPLVPATPRVTTGWRPSSWVSPR